MSDKRMKILEMIEKKQITAQEGMELLNRLESSKRKKEEMKKPEPEAVKQRGDIVKLSEADYEILPMEPAKGTSLTKKKGAFGGLFGGGRKLVIRVVERGKNVVNIRVPLFFAEHFLKKGITAVRNQSVSQQIRVVSEEMIEQYLKGDMRGILVDVYDEEDDTRVYIAIE